jgi:hypothetical protein
MPLFVPPLGWERTSPQALPPPHLAAYYEPADRLGHAFIAVLSTHADESSDDTRADPREGDPAARVIGREQATVCGLPATLTTRRYDGPPAATIVTVRVAAPDRVYAIEYGRIGETPGDPAALAFVRRVCVVDDTVRTPGPVRWLPVEGASRFPNTLFGKWDSPTDVGIRANVTLTIKPYRGTALGLLHSGQNALRREAKSAVFGPVRGIAGCGPDALTERQSAVVDGVTVAIEHEIVVVDGRAFIANYVRPATQNDSPAAMAALRSLCGA